MKLSSPRKFLITVLIIVALIAVVAVAVWALKISLAPSNTPAANKVGETSKPTNQPDKTPTVTTRQVKVVYIADGDDGKIGEKIGCGDSAVIVNRSAQAVSDIEGALQVLLADKSEKYGTTALRNALWQSTLTLDSATVVDKTVNVKLSGDLQLSGVCDIPRVKAQLENTVKESSSATTVNVTINGKTLDEALSLK
jgi:hypothetical protein